MYFIIIYSSHPVQYFVFFSTVFLASFLMTYCLACIVISPISKLDDWTSQLNWCNKKIKYPHTKKQSRKRKKIRLTTNVYSIDAQWYLNTSGIRIWIDFFEIVSKRLYAFMIYPLVGWFFGRPPFAGLCLLCLPLNKWLTLHRFFFVRVRCLRTRKYARRSEIMKNIVKEEDK